MSKFAKFLMGLTVFAPTAFSCALACFVFNFKDYKSIWINIFTGQDCSLTFEWWFICISLFFVIVSVLGLIFFLRRIKNRQSLYNSIKAQSFHVVEGEQTNQIISSLLPWMTLVFNSDNFEVLIICVTILSVLITLATYNNSKYNLLLSILGYRYYQVDTSENRFYLLSKKCLKNRCEIKSYIEITDYTGLLINN